MNASVQQAAIANSRSVPPSNKDQERFVGGLGITFRDLIGEIAPNNCDSWFQGANIHYVRAARTAIRQATALTNLRPGDEVLVPSYHCGSEIDVLLSAGLEVRLFRVTADGNIDTEDMRRRLTSATRAVYIIHYFGFAQELASVVDFCRGHGLRLIEDCALSSFTRVDASRIGTAGDVAVYNFPKILPVPDGGALVVNNPELQSNGWLLESPLLFPVLLEMLRLCKPAGFRRLPRAAARALSTHRSKNSCVHSRGRVEMPASYYFSSEMQNRGMSRISRRVLKRTDFSKVRDQRRKNFSFLLEHLQEEPGLTPLFQNLAAGACPLYFPVIVAEARAVARRLRAASIPAVAWWAGYHREEFDWNEFPEARHLKDNLLALPVHHQLDETDMHYIASRFLHIQRGG